VSAAKVPDRDGDALVALAFATAGRRRARVRDGALEALEALGLTKVAVELVFASALSTRSKLSG